LTYLADCAALGLGVEEHGCQSRLPFWECGRLQYLLELEFLRLFHGW
jgi:hypothetical protein